MNRKNFLSSILPLAASFSDTSIVERNLIEATTTAIIPPYLKKDDTIGITCPAGYISIEAIQPAIAKLIEWGFQIKVGNTVGKRNCSFGGTDAERLQDFQSMLDDHHTKAIMSARGGYGSVRIIDGIDFTQFAKRPKWIIGFSDLTVMHCHINRHYGVASIHSKMCNSFPDVWSEAEAMQQQTIESIQQCLTGQKMRYATTANARNKIGDALGPLVGGNLKTIESLAGSASDLVTTNKILFLEDTGEYLYSLDRMFWNLKRTGKLAHLKGLIIGGFKIKPDDEGEPFGKTLEDIVLEKVKEYKYPVCFDFPVGHQKNNFALKCGAPHSLSVNANECTLIEQ